jgi:hypothetical protein
MLRFPSFALLVFAVLISQTASAKRFKVYYLGGQSNMVGFGYNSELPDHLIQSISTVPIFSGAPRMDEDPEGGNGTWTRLSPGFGLGSDFVKGAYVLSERFGPEITFADEMQKLAPDEHFAIIKYAWGGTALVDGVSGFGSWDPTVSKRNQYDYFLHVVQNAMACRDIDGDGETDELIPSGIIWMQGEADAFDDENAALAYRKNLTQMMRLMRAAFHCNNLPVVIGRITDSRRDKENPVMQFSEIIRQAQSDFVQQDAHAILSTITEELAYGEEDEWHYLTPGYLKMGRDFARLVRTLELERETMPSEQTN